jgi:hypothetical protein
MAAAIADADLPHAFERSFVGSGPDSTGLELATAKIIIDKFAASLAVQPEPGAAPHGLPAPLDQNAIMATTHQRSNAITGERQANGLANRESSTARDLLRWLRSCRSPSSSSVASLALSSCLSPAPDTAPLRATTAMAHGRSRDQCAIIDDIRRDEHLNHRTRARSGPPIGPPTRAPIDHSSYCNIHFASWHTTPVARKRHAAANTATPYPPAQRCPAHIDFSGYIDELPKRQPLPGQPQPNTRTIRLTSPRLRLNTATPSQTPTPPRHADFDPD